MVAQSLADSWLGLMVGSSRLHWVWFEGTLLKSTWDMPHLSKAAIASLITHQLDFRAISLLPETTDLSIDLPSQLPPSHLPLWFASVVPSQTELWQTYPDAHKIELGHIPIAGLYPTLGVDRALALWGAIQMLGAPVLVIDAGTALTFTGADARARLVGGAILPGLQLQMRSLHEHTVLPSLHSPDLTALPSRWAVNTPESMQSGILYTLLAGLQDFMTDWLRQFPPQQFSPQQFSPQQFSPQQFSLQQPPGGAIAITGGDRLLLFNLLQQRFPHLAADIKLEPNLIFWGIQAVKTSTNKGVTSAL